LKPPETAASFFGFGALRETAGHVSDLSYVDNGPLTTMAVVARLMEGLAMRQARGVAISNENSHFHPSDRPITFRISMTILGKFPASDEASS